MLKLEEALDIIQVLTCELASAVIYSSFDYNLIDKPRPGDLVLETTTRRKEGVGRLILKREEFVEFKEQEGGYNETFWYIETYDGELQRWYNCHFDRILTKSIFRLRQNDPEDTEWVKEAIVWHKLDQSYPRNI